MKSRVLRCCWAGQLLEKILVTAEKQSEEIENLQERLNSGQITHLQHGVTFVPVELCVDVYEDGEMIAVYNFKKGDLVLFHDLKAPSVGSLPQIFYCL